MIIILLLGSYDPDTKNLMDYIKRELAEKFGGEGVYIYLLDELDVYYSREYFAIIEKWERNKVSVHVFSMKGEEMETFDIPIQTFDEKIIKDECYKLLKEKFPIEKIEECAILDKLRMLARMAKVIILIRDKEETRGGEIAELIFIILNNFSSKLCVFKREGIELSEMIKEFLDQFNVVLRTYKHKEGLSKEILRYVSYRLKES